jgi:acyl-CoA synthetase (AMP-forming)/AMP-acid ligase II
VVLVFENCLEYVISYYGILKAGAVVAPLSTDLKPYGLKPLLRELEPRVVICSSRFERLLQSTDLSHFRKTALILKNPAPGWSSAPFPVISWDEIIRDVAHPDLLTPIEESALASIIYTSGSTGKSKGVMLSHKNIVSNTTAICHYLQLNKRDIQMVVLPFFYVMGKSLLNTHFAVGGTVVINNKFAYTASVVKQMMEERVTGFSGVPATYAYLLHRSPLRRYRDKLDSLRYCSQAGGHMSRQIKRELQNALPAHTKIYIMYGATEASARLTYLEPDRFADKMDSIGKPIPGATLKILDSGGREAPIGQKGELVGAGPNIMQGYWKDAEATARVLDEDGYHTGDLGYQDADGYFYVLGRKDNLLKVGGYKINPREIEDVLMETGLVIEAAVLGRPNAIMGHSLVAALTPKNGDCSEAEIFRQLAERLPKYKLPSELRFVRTLPKSASGKIDKKQLIKNF